MKISFLLLLLLLTFHASSQNTDTCFKKGLTTIELSVHLKGLPSRDLIYVEKGYFKNGFELLCKQENVKVISFRIAYECEGCDFIEIDVCGNKMPENRLRRIQVFGGEESMEVYEITVEINGQFYRAKPFIIRPKG